MSELKVSPRTSDRSVSDVAEVFPHVARKRPMVAVVGGGISGLAVGCYLERSAADCVVFEAADRPGGVIASRHIDGQVLELGPQRTRLTAPLRALVESLDLTDRLITAPDLPLYIFSRGKLRIVPLDLRTALTTDLISWMGRIRILAEPMTMGLVAGESAADYFVRKFGRPTYREAIAPLFGDLYGSDPADMPARYALASLLRTLRVEGSLLRSLIHAFRLKRRVPACSFQGGLQTLTDAMARSLGDRVRTASAVREIHRDGDRFRVVSDADEVTADRVVLSCTAAPAARAMATLDPDVADRFAQLHSNHFAVVHLHSEAPFHGSGYQVTFESGYATRGVTCNDALFDRRGLFTAFLGGSTRPAVPHLPDAELGVLAAAEFRDVTGAESRPVAVHRTYMPAWDWTWEALDGMRLPDGVSICANWLGRPGITGRLNEAAKLAGRLAAV